MFLVIFGCSTLLNTILEQERVFRQLHFCIVLNIKFLHVLSK